MRFSLRTLLLFFPALIVAYALAYWGVAHLETNRTPRAHYKWHDDANNLRDMQSTVNWRIPEEQRVNMQAVLDSYFCNKKIEALPPDTSGLIASLKFDKEDSWGSPYRCVLMKKRLHFYSCGQDGISQSAGNDSDDLNSWSQVSGKFYSDQQAGYEQKQRRIDAIVFLPVTLGMIVGAWLFVRKLFMFSSD